MTIKTGSGTVVVPRTAVDSIEKGQPSSEPLIVAQAIQPADAAKAFDEAKTAVAKSDWGKAGGLLEGLLALDLSTFSVENRLAATPLLITCYLGLKDAKGALRTFTRRAAMMTVPSDKKRILAAAEALDKCAGVILGAKTVTTYDEAISAAMEWKAGELLDQAKDLAAKAKGLDDAAKLEAAARKCLDRLAGADLYVPGYAAAHRKEILAVLIDAIMEGARKAVADCTAEKPILSRGWRTRSANISVAMAWNAKVGPYMARRQAAEDQNKNVKPFAAKFEAPEIYTSYEKECADLLTKLDDLRYIEQLPGMPEKLLFNLILIGS